jgi:hypothetical protein
VRSVTERVHRKHGERLREEDEGHGCGSSHSCSQDTAPQALAVSEAGEEEQEFLLLSSSCFVLLLLQFLLFFWFLELLA